MPPMGEGDVVEAAGVLLDFVQTEFPHARAAMVRAPEDMATALAEAGFRVVEDRDNFDYIYRVNDLVRPEGRKYHSQRNLIRGCLRANECEYESVTSQNTGDCLNLEEEWCNIGQAHRHPELADELRAIRQALEHSEELDLLGAAIRTDGKMGAFSIGERLDHETAVVHFEKADRSVRGLYQLINRWFCANEIPALRWVNREQDLGLEGLRKAKMSYTPHHFVKKFTVLKGA